VPKLPRYYSTRDSCEKNGPNLPDCGEKKEKRKKLKPSDFDSQFQDVAKK
jgi:hypothetical protein